MLYNRDVARHPFISKKDSFKNNSRKKGADMVRKELREHIFKMLFQIEFNESLMRQVRCRSI